MDISELELDYNCNSDFFVLKSATGRRRVILPFSLHGFTLPIERNVVIAVW